MEARHGVVGRVWIADRGMASAENLAWLRQTGRRYIIGAPKAQSAQLRRRAGRAAVAGARSARASRSSWRAGPRRARRRSCAARPTGAARSRPCTTSSASASRRRWPAWPRASSARPSGSIAAQHQPPDRPHPPAEPARRRPLPDHPAGRRLSGRLVVCTSSTTAAFDDVGRHLGRRLRAAHQHRGLERRATVEGLHPAHPGRGRLPHPQGSAATCARSGISAPIAFPPHPEERSEAERLEGWEREERSCRS